MISAISNSYCTNNNVSFTAKSKIPRKIEVRSATGTTKFFPSEVGVFQEGGLRRSWDTHIKTSSSQLEGLPNPESYHGCPSVDKIVLNQGTGYTRKSGKK